MSDKDYKKAAKRYSPPPQDIESILRGFTIYCGFGENKGGVKMFLRCVAAFLSSLRLVEVELSMVAIF